jgi:hypothetical protein
MTTSMSLISLPSSRYVRSDESDHAGRFVLSDESGGDVSMSFWGIGAGREGGGIVSGNVVGGASRVGEGEVLGCKVERPVVLDCEVEGLSSGVGVEMGELVSWLDVSPVSPGGC